MIDDASPTLRRRELGAHLRRLRKERGWTTKDVADKLNFSVSKVSRMETGARGVNSRDMAALADLFELDADWADHLDRIARTGKKRNEHRAALSWDSDYLSVVDPQFLDLEKDAVRIREYNSMVVPGLLQIEPYMRASVRGMTPDIPEFSVEESISLRLQRQEILSQSNLQRPVYEVVLDEATLWRQVGGSNSMRDQLDFLTQAMEEVVDLRIIPFAAGAHPGMNSDFVSLELGDSEVPDAVFVEGLAGQLRFDAAQDVARYNRIWQRLAEMAASGQEAIQLLRRARRAL